MLTCVHACNARLATMRARHPHDRSYSWTSHANGTDSTLSGPAYQCNLHGAYVAALGRLQDLHGRHR